MGDVFILNSKLKKKQKNSLVKYGSVITHHHILGEPLQNHFSPVGETKLFVGVFNNGDLILLRSYVATVALL